MTFVSYFRISPFFQTIERYFSTFYGAPDKPCGVGRADANPKLLLNDT